MATSTVPMLFSLVYLVWNSIGNLRTKAEQVACFGNAAQHPAPGGRFVIELWVPGIRRLPSGQTAVPFHGGEPHQGFDTYDMTTQRGTSHHYFRDAGGTVTYSAGKLPLHLGGRVRPDGTACRDGARAPRSRLGRQCVHQRRREPHPCVAPTSLSRRLAAQLSRTEAPWPESR